MMTDRCSHAHTQRLLVLKLKPYAAAELRQVRRRIAVTCLKKRVRADHRDTRCHRGCGVRRRREYSARGACVTDCVRRRQQRALS
jgi:hypothetical protein